MAIGNTGDPLQANVFRTGDAVAYEDLQGDSASFKENGAGSNPTQEALFDTIAMVDGDDCAAYIIRLIKLSTASLRAPGLDLLSSLAICTITPIGEVGSTVL